MRRWITPVVAVVLFGTAVAGPSGATASESPDLHAAQAALVTPTAWIAALPTWTMSNDLTLHWGATPAAPDGVRRVFDVRERRAPWNGAFGSWRERFVDGEATSWTIRVYRGYTYCYSARVQDDGGSASSWSPATCTAIPLDDRSLTRSSSWVAGTGTAYWASTYLRSSTHGARLTRYVAARRIALVATTCPTCGTVKVYLGSTLLKTVSLYSTTTVNRKLIAVATFTPARSGFVTIQVSSSGRRVLIDGLAIRRN